jgi:hypothetical protein
MYKGVVPRRIKNENKKRRKKSLQKEEKTDI